MIHLSTKHVTDTNLIKAASIYVTRESGLKKVTIGKKTEPWWKNQISDIQKMRQNIDSIPTVVEEQRPQAKAAKRKKYEEKIN